MSYYFAYGSNMNPERMKSRHLKVVSACSAVLNGFGLRFNKRSRRDANLACANIAYAPNERVEGVLYQLENPSEIIKLDPHEGAPFRYSREQFFVQVNNQKIATWIYVANPGVIDNSIKPARWYVEHLLAGKPFLTDEYWQKIDQTICRKETQGIMPGGANAVWD